ncbi:MAG: hypothetical protein ACREV9_07210 [Burkholderiales bacterium]
MAQNAAVSPGAPPVNLAGRLFQVAWLAVLLGLAIQGLTLLTALGFGQNLEMNRAVAETVGKVSWAGIVCLGLALGAAVARAGPRSFALAGLLAAPIAFILARSLHKSVGQALDVAGSAASESVFVFALLKAIEYGCLGYLLAIVSSRVSPRMMHMPAPVSRSAWYSARSRSTSFIRSRCRRWSRAESTKIVFPIGCSIVIYASDIFGRRVTSE